MNRYFITLSTVEGHKEFYNSGKIVDLLIAVCNRKEDAVDNEFLLSFMITDYVQAYAAVVRQASEIVEV